MILYKNDFKNAQVIEKIVAHDFMQDAVTSMGIKEAEILKECNLEQLGMLFDEHVNDAWSNPAPIIRAIKMRYGCTKIFGLSDSAKKEFLIDLQEELQSLDMKKYMSYDDMNYGHVRYDSISYYDGKHIIAVRDGRKGLITKNMQVVYGFFDFEQIKGIGDKYFYLYKHPNGKKQPVWIRHCILTTKDLKKKIEIENGSISVYEELITAYDYDKKKYKIYDKDLNERSEELSLSHDLTEICVNGKFLYVADFGSDKKGVIDGDCTWHVEPEYTFINKMHDEKHGWDYIVATKKKLVGHLYDESKRMLNDELDLKQVIDKHTYVVKANGKEGILNYDGQWLTPPVFKSLEKVIHKNRVFILGRKENYDDCWIFDEHLNCTSKFAGYLRYDEKNKEFTCSDKVVNIIYERNELIDDSKTGFFTRMFSKRKHVLDNGSTIIKDKRGWKFTDENSKQSGGTSFECIYEYVGQLAIAKANGKFGAIDKKGKFIVKPEYDFMSNFINGCSIVVKDGKRGLFNASGKEIISPAYDDIVEVHEKHVKVLDNGKYGVVDINGRMIVDAVFDHIGALFGDGPLFNEDGAAFFIKDGHSGIINDAGKILFEIDKKIKLIKDKCNNILICDGNKRGLLGNNYNMIADAKYDSYQSIRNGEVIFEDFDKDKKYLYCFGKAGLEADWIYAGKHFFVLNNGNEYKLYDNDCNEITEEITAENIKGFVDMVYKRIMSSKLRISDEKLLLQDLNEGLNI